MQHIIKTVFFILITLSTQSWAETNYMPDSGDEELDASLIEINKKIQNKTAAYSRRLANEFQVPEEQVVLLFTHYEFTPADILMTLSIADTSGQPVNNVARTYFDNKESGWKYTLYQLKISKKSETFKQIKKDAQAEY